MLFQATNPIVTVTSRKTTEPTVTVTIAAIQRIDEQQVALFFKGLVTGLAGVLTVQVNDTWWGNRGLEWNGTNVSYPSVWEITDDASPEGTATVATFIAVREFRGLAEWPSAHMNDIPETKFLDSVRATQTATGTGTSRTDVSPSRTPVIAGVVASKLPVVKG
ncbi:hypothetical protein B0H17DRAFT_1143615 [Mycena rosella]|uniref:Uncharacterized protein n=1 Tax=Mycena rosella TaxID=1033263 RepID=A0AAD7CV89_MYCRO|nr:hypothetical protein B0H17DRAFT_1143615 [Mycena rosella]